MYIITRLTKDVRALFIKALSHARRSRIVIVDNDYLEHLYASARKSNANISICGWYLKDKSHHLNAKTLSGDEAYNELLIAASFESYYWNRMH